MDTIYKLYSGFHPSFLAFSLLTFFCAARRLFCLARPAASNARHPLLGVACTADSGVPESAGYLKGTKKRKIIHNSSEIQKHIGDLTLSVQQGIG